MAAFANTAAALQAARAAASSGLPYSTAVAQSGLLAGFRQDCSGLADYILAKAGYSVGGETTVGLAQTFKQGQNPSGITLWDIPQPGQSGHVIEDVGGQWFESGGMTGGGPHQMSTEQVEQELGVSSLSQLGNSATPRGFIPLDVPSSGSNSGMNTGDPTTDLAQLWIDAGGNPGVANTMAAIAMAESGGNVGAQNSSSGAAGLWQILPSAHPQYNIQQLLSDPLYNAQAAVAVFKSQGFGAWSTYTSGAYRQYLAGAANAQYTGAGATYGGTRPGGSPANSTGNPGEILSDYLTLRDTPRTAPPGTKNPFAWWFASFSGNWDTINNESGSA